MQGCWSSSSLTQTSCGRLKTPYSLVSVAEVLHSLALVNMPHCVLGSLCIPLYKVHFCNVWQVKVSVQMSCL
jgi:hypothetical protein